MSRRKNRAPGIAEMVGAYGPGLPMKPAVVEPGPAPKEKINRRAAPPRGHAAAGCGWAACSDPRLKRYRADTLNAGGLYPLLATPGLPPVGALLGKDVQAGGGFYCDPIEWVERKIVANPNFWIFGKPGRGKTSTILALALRLMAFGVKVLVAGDVKGEYTAAARALGPEPPVLADGRGGRINPLDAGLLTQRHTGLDREGMAQARDDLVARWLAIQGGLCSYAGHSPDVTDHEVLAGILREATGITTGAEVLSPITIPTVHDWLAHPTSEMISGNRFAGQQHFLDHLRPLTDALGKLIRGELAGLFDGETSFHIDWDAPIISMDLSRVKARGKGATGIALACLGAWSRSAVDARRRGEIRMIIRDELWRQIGLGPGMVEAVNEELRLSRDEQIISVFSTHKPDDLRAGGAGATEIAENLLGLADTRVLLGQDSGIADELATKLGLSDIEQHLMTTWGMADVGRTLWKVGETGYQVEMVRTPVESELMETNTNLRDKAPEFPSPDVDGLGALGLAGG
jgi:ATP:corrinoid adenosyltransferase